MKKLIFVYGTLKRGYGNHRLLTDASFMGPAVTTQDTFLMFDNGSFPYVLSNGKFFIRGELYEVRDQLTLDRMDRLEGHPTFYTRTETTVRLDDMSTHYCEMYVASARTAERVRTSCAQVSPTDDNIMEWNRHYA